MKATIYGQELRDLLPNKVTEKQLLALVDYIDTYASDLRERNNAYLQSMVSQLHTDMTVLQAQHKGMAGQVQFHVNREAAVARHFYKLGWKFSAVEAPPMPANIIVEELAKVEVQP